MLYAKAFQGCTELSDNFSPPIPKMFLKIFRAKNWVFQVNLYIIVVKAPKKCGEHEKHADD
jgi:hypothetical protein